jgi:hypothetical protein
MRSLADLALARAETMLPKYKNGIANQSQHHSRIDEKPPEVCEAATLKDHGPLTDDLLAALLPPEHNQGFIMTFNLFLLYQFRTRYHFNFVCAIKCQSSLSRGLIFHLLSAFKTHSTRVSMHAKN